MYILHLYAYRYFIFCKISVGLTKQIKIMARTPVSTTFTVIAKGRAAATTVSCSARARTRTRARARVCVCGCACVYSTDPLLCAIGTHTDVFANTTPFKFLLRKIDAYGTQLTLHRLGCGCYDMQKASWYIKARRSEWHAAARQAMDGRRHVAGATFALVDDTCLDTECLDTESLDTESLDTESAESCERRRGTLRRADRSGTPLHVRPWTAGATSQTPRLRSWMTRRVWTRRARRASK